MVCAFTVVVLQAMRATHQNISTVEISPSRLLWLFQRAAKGWFQRNWAPGLREHMQQSSDPSSKSFQILSRVCAWESACVQNLAHCPVTVFHSDHCWGLQLEYFCHCSLPQRLHEKLEDIGNDDNILRYQGHISIILYTERSPSPLDVETRPHFSLHYCKTSVVSSCLVADAHQTAWECSRNQLLSRKWYQTYSKERAIFSCQAKEISSLWRELNLTSNTDVSIWQFLNAAPWDFCHNT